MLFTCHGFLFNQCCKVFYVRNLRMFYTAEEFVPRLMFASKPCSNIA